MALFRQMVGFVDGFIGAAIISLALTVNHIISPSQNVLYDSLGILTTFRGSSAGPTNVGGQYIHILGDTFATSNGGNVIQYVGKSAWFIGGSGPVKTTDPTTPSTIVTIGTGGSLLQIAIVSAGHYITAVQAGILAPAAVTIAGRSSLGAGFTGKNTGIYSIVITKVRSSTGGESLASDSSNVISVSGQSIRVEFGAAPTDGSDTYIIYATGAGFGTSGPYFKLMEVTEAVVNASTTDGVARAIEIEWADSDLLPLKPPLDNFPPEAGNFVFSLGNVMCVAGTFGGVGLSVSVPGQPEAFPPDFASFLPEQIIGIAKGRAQNGFVYLLCANSVHAAMYTGAAGGPVIVRPVWDSIGCAGPASACVAGTTLYMATPDGSFVRTGLSGEPDTVFGTPVDSSITGWTATNIVVANDIKRKYVAFIHNQEAYLWQFKSTPSSDIASSGVSVGGDSPGESVSQGRWSGTINLAAVSGSGQPTGTITSAITLGGRLKILSHESSNYNIYTFDDGSTGTSTWFFTTGWQSFGDPDMKTLTGFKLGYDSTTSPTITSTIYKNLDVSAGVAGPSFTMDSTQKITQWQRTNVDQCEYLAIKLAGTGANQKLRYIQAVGHTSGVRI